MRTASLAGISASAAWVILAGDVQAEPVAIFALGIVDFVDEASPLAQQLNVNDEFSITAIYDDLLVTGVGTEVVALDDIDSVFILEFEAANLGFSSSDDPLFGLGFPALEFIDGAFSGFDFSSNAVPLEGTSFEFTFAPQAANDLAIFQTGGFLPVGTGTFTSISQEPVSPD